MAEGRLITLDEVKSHNKAEDLWIIINNKVYDVTSFLSEHPGGEIVLLNVGGKDGTKDFLEVGHSSIAEDLMVQYFIGDLSKSDAEMTEDKSKTSSKSGSCRVS